MGPYLVRYDRPIIWWLKGSKAYGHIAFKVGRRRGILTWEAVKIDEWYVRMRTLPIFCNEEFLGNSEETLCHFVALELLHRDPFTLATEVNR